MAGRRPPTRKAVVFAQTPSVGNAQAQRALDVVSSAVRDLQARRHLEQFTAIEPGYVPPAGTVTSAVLHADGVWRTVGSSGSSGVAAIVAGTNISISGGTGTVTVNVVNSPSFSGNVTLGDSGADSHIVNGTIDFNHAVNVDGTFTLSTFTQGSVLFVGSSGLVSQDNTHLFWDDTNNRLGIGNAAPAQALHVTGTGRFTTGLIVDTMTSGSVWFAGASGVLTQDNANLFWDDTNNRLGIGTAGPATFLDIRGSLASTDVIHVRNTTTAGYSAVAFLDNGGTLRGATGFGNSTVSDSTVQNRLYWRTLGSDMIFTTGSGTPSTPAIFLTNTNGNVNIGGTAGDPGVKLRVEGAFSYTGIGTLGDATTDTHTINGATTVFGPTTAIGLEVRTTAQANIRIRGDSDGTNDSSYTGLVIARGSSPTELWYIGRNGTGNNDGLIFRRAGTTDDVTIDTSGNATFAGLVTGLANLHLDTSTSDLVGPELDFIGRNGQWLVGIDVANPTTSRDFVLVGQRGTYSFKDGATTSGSPTVTSAAEGGFSSAIVGKTISGSGIPGGTTVLSVAGPTSLTMSANATATASSVRITITSGDTFDILYMKHRGGLSPTIGFGVTPPDGAYRFQVSPADSEPAMGGLGMRVGPSQTGHAISVFDSGGTARVWTTSDFYLSGNHALGGAIAIQAEGTNQRPLVFVKNDKSTAYGFQYSGTDIAFRYFTGGINAWTVNTSGKLTAVNDFAVDGSATLGNADTDTHTINGRPTISGPGANASGRQDAARINNFAQATASDSQVIHWSFNSQDTYNVWIGAKITNSSPSFLDPRFIIAIQDVSTTGTANVTERLVVTNAGVAVTGTFSTSGNCTLGDAAGDAHTINGTLTCVNAVTLNSTLSVEGNTTLGNASSDTITATAHIPSTLTFASSTGPTIRGGSGSPEGVVTAVVGSLFLRSDGGASTTLYVKESGSGSTGWAAK